MRGSLAERLWARVRKTETCWEWTGALHETGYGIIGLGTRRDGVDRTHRVSYRLHFGEIPDGLVILHACDNRRCVRPEHLSLGTQLDNVADMRAKGRAVDPPRQLGTKNVRARVVEVRGEKRCLNEWSRITGLKAGTIKARLNRGWSAERALELSA